MNVENDLRQSMEEELSAARAYRDRAYLAYKGGDDVSAKLWSHIAEEEDGHYNEFKDRLSAIHEEASAALAIEAFQRLVSADLEKNIPRVAGKRSFPQTYGDWVDLAEDIKAKDPSPETSSQANMMLNTIISEAREPGREPPGDVDTAKRWLVQKADELGIS